MTPPNITTKDLAVTLEDWAFEVTGFNHYAHMPTSILEALPLVICEVQRDIRGDRDADLPQVSNFQQAYVRARRATLLLMCDPEPSWTSSQVLYDAVDQLAEALRTDSTLGGRVYQASPKYEAGYTPPEVEHADGTRTRVASFDITVGELIGVA